MGVFIIINVSLFALRLDYSPIVSGSETACTLGNTPSEQERQQKGQGTSRARGEEALLPRFVQQKTDLLHPCRPLILWTARSSCVSGINNL